MSEIGLIQIVEGALLAAGKPLTVSQLGDLFEEHERPDTAAIREALEQIEQRCDDRGFELLEVASGFRFQVRQSLSPWVARLWQERPQKYSRALLETLALIAYRQPITRGEIEEIRGVAVSTNIVKTLHEREWIRVVGHRDVPGRPAMYATTRQFLDYFNLNTLEQLPALAEIRDLETLNAELGFTESLPEEGAGPADDGSSADDSGDGQSAAENPGLTVVGGTDHAPQAEAAVVQEELEGHADAASPAGEMDVEMLLDAVDGLQAQPATGDTHAEEAPAEAPEVESEQPGETENSGEAQQLASSGQSVDTNTNTEDTNTEDTDTDANTEASGVAEESSVPHGACSDAQPDETPGAVDIARPDSQA